MSSNHDDSPFGEALRASSLFSKMRQREEAAAASFAELLASPVFIHYKGGVYFLLDEDVTCAGERFVLYMDAQGKKHARPWGEFFLSEAPDGSGKRFRQVALSPMVVKEP